MDGLDGLEGLSQWKCPRGHVLGVTKRVRVSNHGTSIYYSVLMKFHDAIDLTVEKPIEVNVDCEIEGTTRVFCNVPGCVDDEGQRTVREWQIDEKRVAMMIGSLYQSQKGSV